jgi:putative flippase GtrA
VRSSENMKNQTFLELIKFSIVGVLNTIVDFGVFSLLITNGCPVLPSQIISYGCGMLNSFMMNHSWTFKDNKRTGFSRPIKYLTVNIITLSFMSVILLLLTNPLQFPIIFAKVVCTVLGMVVNFLCSKFWVFQREENTGYE